MARNDTRNQVDPETSLGPGSALVPAKALVNGRWPKSCWPEPKRRGSIWSGLTAC